MVCFFNQGLLEASKTAPTNSSMATVSTTSLYFKSRQSNTQDLTTFYREKSWFNIRSRHNYHATVRRVTIFKGLILSEYGNPLQPNKLGQLINYYLIRPKLMNLC